MQPIGRRQVAGIGPDLETGEKTTEFAVDDTTLALQPLIVQGYVAVCASRRKVVPTTVQVWPA